MPRGDHQARHLGPNALDDRRAPAECDSPGCRRTAPAASCRQHFAEQIAMTLLDIDELEADLVRQPGRRDVMIDQPLADRRRRAVDSWHRCSCRSLYRRCAGSRIGSWNAITACDSCNGPSASVAGRRTRSSSLPQVSRWACRHCCSMRSRAAAVSLAEEQLPRLGPAFFDDRGRLAPDQLGSAGAETLITAIASARRAGRRGCRRSPPSAECTANCRREAGHMHRTKQRTEIVR